MSGNERYTEKLNEMLLQLPIARLNDQDSRYLRSIAVQYLFTFQDLKKVLDISIDLHMWQAGKLDEHCPAPTSDQNIKQLKKKAINKLESYWSELKRTKKDYKNFHQITGKEPNKISNIIFKPSPKTEDTKVLGKCPVASEKTLCCNLETLDVVDNCGFECAYCSIQSFFPSNTILVEDQLSKKLNRLNINPDKIYHIGTGQSSDSLMWGNKNGILDELILFAKKHPKVILEFKTKSKNISYFLKNDIPRNIICTWSLNPDTIIENEEHHTATLDERIESARKLSNKGILVGFHLHPIIYYENYEIDYSQLAIKLTSTFQSSEIAMISMGTLTFTKPVLKEIRKKSIYSKILQMPLVNENGKLSYPEDIKTQIFSAVYNSFCKWHRSVFFYLCMEDHSYWPKVFGFSFKNNLEFETNMKENYMSKILLKSSQPS